MKKTSSYLSVAAAIVTTLLPALASAQSKVFQGIYALGDGQNSAAVIPNVSQYPWTSPCIAGIALRASWPAIEPNQGGISWTMFDQALALAKQSNKKIALAVIPGVNVPSWLKNEGAQTINVVVDQSTGARADMTVPWDPTFQREWSALVKAEGARYDNDPNVAYVTIGGPGHYLETYVVSNEADYATLNAAGGLPKWIQGTEAIIDMYGAAFKKTPFMLVLANPVSNVASSNAAGQAAVQRVIDYGMARYPGRFGISCYALKDTSLTSKPVYFVNQLIMQHSATAPTGFQMISPATSSKNKFGGEVGNLGVAAADGLQMGGQYIEVYRGDVSNPVFGTLLQTANKQLNGF